MARSRQSGSGGGASGTGRQTRARGTRSATRARKTGSDVEAGRDTAADDTAAERTEAGEPTSAGRAAAAATPDSAGTSDATEPTGVATRPEGTEKSGAAEKPATTAEPVTGATATAAAVSATEISPGEAHPRDDGKRATADGPGWRLPLLGGLLGGAAVALIVLYLTPEGPPDPRILDRLDETTARLGEIEGALSGRLEAVERNAASLTGRLEELATRSAAFEERLAPLEPLPSRLETIDRRLGALQPALATIGELGERIAALEQRLDEMVLSLPSGGETPGTLAGELEDRLEALEGRSRDLETTLARLDQRLGDDIGGLREALAGLEEQGRKLGGQLRALEDELRDVRTTLGKDVAGLDDRLEEVAGRIEKLDGELAALAGLAGTVAELQRTGRGLAERIASLEQRLAALRTARERAVGLVLAANDLSLAALRGGSITRPLADIEALAGEDPTLRELVERLRPHAETGIPTPARLVERFAALAPAMLGRETGGDSVLEKTRGNLEALVTIRRRGEALDPAAAAVDRARTALAEGRIENAVAALEPLAEAGNAAAAEWVALAEARLAALGAIAELDGYVRRLLVDSRSKS